LPLRACAIAGAALLAASALRAQERAGEVPAESPRSEAARTEAARPEAPRPEAPRTEYPHMISGQVARVLDGDTLEVIVGKRRVRVHVNGVDAPELRQPWGKQARMALEQMVLGQSVDLLPVGPDRGSRLTAVVFVGEAEVGSALVSAGNAWADRHALRPSDAGLCEVEQTAREGRLGLWSLPLLQRVAPWEYRGLFLHTARADYTHETAEHCMSVALGQRARRAAPIVPAAQAATVAPAAPAAQSSSAPASPSAQGSSADQ
jgi:endonuclease YncB( thermonuclease family)